jgi:hypothetical protein
MSKSLGSGESQSGPGFRTNRTSAEYRASLTPPTGTCVLRRLSGSTRLKSGGRSLVSFGGSKSGRQFMPQRRAVSPVSWGCNK